MAIKCNDDGEHATENKSFFQPKVSMKAVGAGAGAFQQDRMRDDCNGSTGMLVSPRSLLVSLAVLCPIFALSLCLP